MTNHQLILEGSEWGTAAIVFGGLAYAQFRIYINPTSPTLDNGGYSTWFNNVSFSVENSTLNLNGNAFNGATQVHVDSTSTLTMNNINLDGETKVALPQGVPSCFGDDEGKAIIPVVAEEGAIFLPNMNFPVKTRPEAGFGVDEMEERTTISAGLDRSVDTPADSKCLANKSLKLSLGLVSKEA